MKRSELRALVGPKIDYFLDYTYVVECDLGGKKCFFWCNDRNDFLQTRWRFLPAKVYLIEPDLETMKP